MNINEWAKPIPKLELPPRVHLQKASKIKQIWEMWSVNVALAMSTWNDVAVTTGIRSITNLRRAIRTGGVPVCQKGCEKRNLYVCKAPVPATCDAVEALLRHELLAHLPEWLSRKAGVLGCTSSSTILFMCWKEIFPNEDAARFDLADELHALPAKLPTSMYQFASWLEDWMTKLVVADEVSAHIESDGGPYQHWKTSPVFLQHLHDGMSGYLSGRWTARRCDHCKSPGCVPESGGLSQSTSTRTSSGSSSRACSTTSFSQKSRRPSPSQAQ